MADDDEEEGEEEEGEVDGSLIFLFHCEMHADSDAGKHRVENRVALAVRVELLHAAWADVRHPDDRGADERMDVVVRYRKLADRQAFRVHFVVAEEARLPVVEGRLHPRLLHSCKG